MEASTRLLDRAGEYSWLGVLAEHGSPAASPASADDRLSGPGNDVIASLLDREDALPADEHFEPAVPDWASIDYDPAEYLPTLSAEAAPSESAAGTLPDEIEAAIQDWLDRTPVSRGAYTWEHFKWEYHYTADGRRPRDADDTPESFEEGQYLTFEPTETGQALTAAAGEAAALADLVEERTVSVNPDLDEDAFFSSAEGATTLTNRYDLEKAVPMGKKPHFEEVERYWVDKPNAFVIIFHSVTENEEKYYVIDPHLNDIEDELRGYIAGKLRTAIRYSDDNYVVDGTADDRREVIEHETRRLLARYDLVDRSAGDTDVLGTVTARVGLGAGGEVETETSASVGLDGIEARPEPAIIEDDPGILSEYQVEKLLYRLARDFIGYDRIDGIKRDINVEDISCDGYNSPVFVYHTEYEQLITNVAHGESELDNFVIKLAQRSGKGISKREPQVDATLPDGSRAQLTLGREVSDHGTNYTIRQFNDVPFTPVDLINWNTFSLDQMAYLWLCIENEKSVMFGGGTASGKTTSLNAVSLFIPSTSKIVSIEDTREVELPQRNWVASITRPSFTEDAAGDVDEFDLLEAALRQRPEYIVMGEVRGEEGRTLFQVMSTGHTTLTTFHADSVGEVIKRFTTDPINVSKTMFTALDIVSIQTQTRVGGRKVRRNRGLTDVNYYEPEHDEINVTDVFEWQPESDRFTRLTRSNVLGEIQFDRGWDRSALDRELFKRRVVLAYLVDKDLNAYAEVAATVQAFINDPDTILALIARDSLEASLEDLRGMESVMIDVEPEKEELVPRPTPCENARQAVEDVLSRAERELLPAYETMEPSPLVSALPEAEGLAEGQPEGEKAAEQRGGDSEFEAPVLEAGQSGDKAGVTDTQSTVADTGSRPSRETDWLSGRLNGNSPARESGDDDDADSGPE